MDELDDAAAAALWGLRLSATERMGALYREGEGYARTPTIEGGDTGVKGALQVPSGTLAALFHNHPPHPGRSNAYSEQRFSDDDKAQARRLRVPSYTTTADGTVRSFDPRTNKTQEVLAQFPMEHIPKRMLQPGRSYGQLQ